MGSWENVIYKQSEIQEARDWSDRVGGQSCETEPLIKLWDLGRHLVSELNWIVQQPVGVQKIKELVIGVGKYSIEITEVSLHPVSLSS